jgi:hypothetical protein
MTKLIIILIVLIAILFWIGSLYGQEELTDGKLSLELSEDMANFHYEWDVEMSASVKPNTCNACIKEAGEDYDTRLMCFKLYCD